MSDTKNPRTADGELMDLTDHGVKWTKLIECDGLAEIVSAGLGVKLPPPLTRVHVIPQVLEAVSEYARNLTIGVNLASRRHNSLFHAPAAAELLDLSGGDDHPAFVPVREAMCHSRKTNWSKLLESEGKSSGRKRRIRAGTWIDVSGKHASDSRDKLFKAFAETLEVYLNDPRYREHREHMRASILSDPTYTQGMHRGLSPDDSEASGGEPRDYVKRERADADLPTRPSFVCSSRHHRRPGNCACNTGPYAEGRVMPKSEWKVLVGAIVVELLGQG